MRWVPEHQATAYSKTSIRGGGGGEGGGAFGIVEKSRASVTACMCSYVVGARTRGHHLQQKKALKTSGERLPLDVLAKHSNYLGF